MKPDDISALLDSANRGRFAIRLRAVNPSGNTVEVVGYVTGIQQDGRIRFSEGDAKGGQVHDFPQKSVLRVERVHGA